MNEEIKLKLQAYLDGEVSSREAAEISALLNHDNEAQLLAQELRFMRQAMIGNEPSFKLPETHDFFWSKIEREIEGSEKQAAPVAAKGWWRPSFARYIGGFAAASALLMISLLAFNGQNTSLPGEMESTGEEMGAIRYHSDADQMTVVYLFDRDREKVVDSK
ncbi:MAG: hypothetical protein ABI042_12570 [Verrucomicrobiota bacterium]